MPLEGVFVRLELCLYVIRELVSATSWSNQSEHSLNGLRPMRVAQPDLNRLSTNNSGRGPEYYGAPRVSLPGPEVELEDGPGGWEPALSRTTGGCGLHLLCSVAADQDWSGTETEIKYQNQVSVSVISGLTMTNNNDLKNIRVCKIKFQVSVLFLDIKHERWRDTKLLVRS